MSVVPNNNIHKALKSGIIDELQAELIGYKCRYRHEHTNYDDQYHDQLWDELRSYMPFDDAKEEMRRIAHENKRDTFHSVNFNKWQVYLDFYDFNSKYAKHLTTILHEPSKCHPCWFKEAELAIKRHQSFPSSYGQLKVVINQWREDRDK